MRRSEMIEAIAGLLVFYVEDEDVNEVGNEILTMMEQKGMNPPANDDGICVWEPEPTKEGE